MNYWNGIMRYGSQNRDGPNFNTSFSRKIEKNIENDKQQTT